MIKAVTGQELVENPHKDASYFGQLILQYLAKAGHEEELKLLSETPSWELTMYEHFSSKKEFPKACKLSRMRELALIIDQ